MDYVDVAGTKISRMTLGTVQLGMNYGIANNAGQPKEEQSFAMLQSALDLGINSFDTARLYGNSENVIGNFLKTQDKVPFLTTKVPNIPEGNDAEVEKQIITYVETSLETLGVKKVNNVMLHNAGNLYYKPDVCAKTLAGLVKRGYCDIVGASVYTADEVCEILKHEEYSVTQIPMSIFDQQLINGGIVDELKNRGFTVFVRSVFLQGLFFLDPEKITDEILLKEAKPGILKLRSLCEKENMSLAEIAIAFIRDIPGVTSLVLGADTPEQVKLNASYFDVPSLSEETVHEIKTTFKNVNIPEIMKVLSRPKK